MTQKLLAQRELVITRRLKAPRELVWRTFEDPYLLAQWWGPENFKSVITKLDFRPSGEWHVTMQAPDGTQIPVRYQFLDISAPQHILYQPLRSEHPYWNGSPPPSYLAKLTFEASGNETVFTMHAQFESADDLNVSIQGGFLRGTNEALDKLEQLAIAPSAGEPTCLDDLSSNLLFSRQR